MEYERVEEINDGVGRQEERSSTAQKKDERKNKRTLARCASADPRMGLHRSRVGHSALRISATAQIGPERRGTWQPAQWPGAFPSSHALLPVLPSPFTRLEQD
jgi:hypothetical protein